MTWSKTNAELKKRCNALENIMSKLYKAFEVMVAGVDALKTHNMEANANLDVLYKNRYAYQLPRDVLNH